MGWGFPWRISASTRRCGKMRGLDDRDARRVLTGRRFCGSVTRGRERVGRNSRQEERKQLLVVSRDGSFAVRGRGMNPLIDGCEGWSVIGL